MKNTNQKFQKGDKVTPVIGEYAGRIGTVVETISKKLRIQYVVSFNFFNKVTRYFWSYELDPAYNYETDEISKDEEFISINNKQEQPFHTIDSPLFDVGNIVKVFICTKIPNLGKIVNITLKDGKYIYKVEFPDKTFENYFDYQIGLASVNDIAFYNHYMEMPMIESFNLDTNEIVSEDNERCCQLCGMPFSESKESKEEPGTCEFCIEQRNLISEVIMRKAANIDLGKFSVFGHEGDWLEVTEWTNGEGVDISIHYASDHDETNRDFMLSYDELSAIMNIVNKFGTLPTIFTKKQE